MVHSRCGVMIAIGLLLATTLAVAQSSIDAAYVRGRVKELPEKKPGKLDVGDADVLKFTWQKGTWKVPFSQIKTIYISLSRRSVLGEAFGLAGAAAASAKRRKLLLSLSFTDDQGRNRNCVFFLPAGSSREFLDTLETKVGREAVFESAEARKAIQAY